jgi:hypothetical protein
MQQVASSARDSSSAMGQAAAASDQSTGASKRADAAGKSLTETKKGLKEAVKGLALQFPILGSIAEKVFNPIGLAIGGIIAGLAIFRSRVDSLTQALTGVQLPDMLVDTKTISTAASDWAEFAKAVQAVADSYGSVKTESDEVTKKLTAQATEKKKLLEMEKGLELARLEAGRGSMKPGEYDTARLGIESRYGNAGLKVDKDLRQNLLAEANRKLANLEISAKEKLAEASGITVNTAEGDAARLKVRSAYAAAAAEDRKKRDGRVEEIDAMRQEKTTPFWWLNPRRFMGTAKYGMSAFSNEDLTSLAGNEYGQIANDRRLEAQGVSAARQVKANDGLRERKSALIQGAGRDIAEATALRGEIPGMAADAAAAQANAGQMEATRQLTDVYRAMAANNAEVSRVAEGLKQAAESKRGADQATIEAVWDLAAYSATLEAQMRQVQERLKNLR